MVDAAVAGNRQMLLVHVGVDGALGFTARAKVAGGNDTGQALTFQGTNVDRRRRREP